MEVVTPLSSRKINRSGEIDWMRAANSLRRSRLASVSRSTAWSDFFSVADPTSSANARSVPNSETRQPHCATGPAVEPTSDLALMPPNPLPDAAPRHRPATYARVGGAPAQPVRCDSVVRKFSLPNPRSPGSDPQAPPTSPRLDRRTRETYGASHPHKLSPSIHSPQSLTKTSLHYLRKCSNVKFQASLGYTVTGAVSYSGNAKGRIYLVMNNNGCGN